MLLFLMCVGTFSIFQCVNAPIICSHPHFYGADRSLVANFESGIHPMKENHSTFMHFEMVLFFANVLSDRNFQFINYSDYYYTQTTGTLFSGARRLQFNLEFVPIEEISYMADVREMYYPMFWVEESSALNATYVNQVEKTVTL